MYPRLKLLQRFLSPDGVIFVSIDDNESATLRCIMDNIFGQNCFVREIVWEKVYSPRNDSKGIPEVTDHIFVYGRQPRWQPKRLERTEEMDNRYKNPDNDFAAWKSGDASAPDSVQHQGMVYAIQHPLTGEFIYPPYGRHWSLGQAEVLDIMKGWCPYELRDLDDADRRAAICGVSAESVKAGVKAIVLSEDINASRSKALTVYNRGQWPVFYFTSGGTGGIARKVYITEVDGKLVTSLWPHTQVGHTDGAKKELKAIFEGKIPFDTPKPSTLIEHILQIATDDYSVVLDSFAGSATTAHAVLKINKENPASHRKFVLIELMDYAETITAERVRRVAQGYSFKGKKEEEIYSKKLTPKNILKAEELLKEASDAIEAHKDKYEKIGKPKIDDNCLKVIGYIKENIRRAFLFTCYCGLRVGDVTDLCWSDISVNGGQHFVSVVMQKNSKPISLPLPAKALSWLPERGEPEASVFSLPSHTVLNKHLRKWAELAGLDRHLHFHLSRHTYGTMLITAGVDLYTASKMMGHADVRPTQVYAKTVDRKKEEAVSLIDKVF